MLMPSIFNDSFFGGSILDEFFDIPTKSLGLSTVSSQNHMMTTDIKEYEGGYELDINLPGFKKEDVTAELKDGYLTISAETKNSKEEKDEKGRYIRRERYSGSCSRSYYIGEEITEEDIKARFENGVLKLDIPKVEEKEIEDKKHYVTIEG